MEELLGCKRVGTIPISNKPEIFRQFFQLAESHAHGKDAGTYTPVVRNLIAKDMERDGYMLLKNKLLRKGDTLVITELDRLSRKKVDIKAELESLKEMGVRVKILNIPTTLIDFPEEQAWVLEMVNNILIEVLGSIAEEERNKIRQRQREGIDCAMAKGTEFGRPKVQYPENWESVRAQVVSKEITSVKAMELLGLKKTSYYKLCKMGGAL